MGRVDKGDQLRQYYRVRSRCIKNYKYNFDFVLDSSITNAFILSYSYSPTTLPITHHTLKGFRLKYCTRKKLGCPRSTTDALPHPPPTVHLTDDCPTPSTIHLHCTAPSFLSEEKVCVLPEVQDTKCEPSGGVVLQRVPRTTSSLSHWSG